MSVTARRSHSHSSLRENVFPQVSPLIDIGNSYTVLGSSPDSGQLGLLESNHASLNIGTQVQGRASQDGLRNRYGTPRPRHQLISTATLRPLHPSEVRWRSEFRSAGGYRHRTKFPSLGRTCTAARQRHYIPSRQPGHPAQPATPCPSVRPPFPPLSQPRA